MATNEGEEIIPSDSTSERATEEQTGSLSNPGELSLPNLTSQSVPEDPLANIMRIFALDAERREV